MTSRKRTAATSICREKFKSRVEAGFALRLESLVQRGRIVAWRYEPFNIRLADNTYYRVDWMIEHVDTTLEFCETKGWHINLPVSVAKWKIAACMHPWWRWSFLQKLKSTWHARVYYHEDQSWIAAVNPEFKWMSRKK